MKLILTYDEFQEARNFVVNTKNANISTVFNKVFSDNARGNFPVKGTVLPKSRDVVIEVTPEDGKKILAVLAKNGGTFGEMLRQQMSISSIPKWLSFFKTIGASISKLFQ